MLPLSVRSSEVKLAGPAATWYDLVVVTNSVCGAAVFAELDHTIASTSEVDTCLSLLPEWGAWRNVPGGMLNVWIETVTDSSNTVSVLLGDPETPVLTIESAKDWTVTPSGSLPPDDPLIPRFGVTTNRLHLAVHSSTRFGFSQAVVETQTAGGSWTSKTNLVPLAFGWFDIPQRTPNWTKVGVCIAGPRAAMTDLHLRWIVDPTVLIIW